MEIEYFKEGKRIFFNQHSSNRFFQILGFDGEATKQMCNNYSRSVY